MKFILGLDNSVEHWELTKTAAIEADSIGFWGLSLPDHYMEAHRMGAGTLESWLALSHLASKTTSVHLGTMVSPIPLRPPALLAKMVATADVISNGRSFLGVGAGWMQAEFDAYSQWDTPRVRVSKTEEGLRLIKELWTRESVDFQGKYFHARGAVLEPKPVQRPNPPLLFGGSSPRMLRLAGRWGDIVFLPPDMKLDFSDAKNIVVESVKKSRRTSQLSFATGLPFRDNHGVVKYDRERFERGVRQAEENGCEYFDFSVPAHGLLDSMKDFSVNVMPSFR